MNRNHISNISDRPPDRKKSKIDHGGNVLDYSSAVAASSWKIERNLADKIMKHVNTHKLDLKLDKLTRGKGNCFMIAVLQQLNQDHVYRVASPQVQGLADAFCHKKFRKAIRNYVLNSEDTRIADMKENYNVARIAGLQRDSWDRYWHSMTKDGTWADIFFIQATAAFLDMDLMIVDTACNEENPFYTIKAQEDSVSITTLTIGLVTDVHYQSLISTSPVQELVPSDHDSSVNELPAAHDSPVHVSSAVPVPLEQELVPDTISNDSCPVCGKKLKNVLLHVQKSKICKERISDSVFNALQSKSLSIKKMKQKNARTKQLNKMKEMIKNKELDESLVKKKNCEAVIKHKANSLH